MKRLLSSLLLFTAACGSGTERQASAPLARSVPEFHEPQVEQQLPQQPEDVASTPDETPPGESSVEEPSDIVVGGVVLPNPKALQSRTSLRTGSAAPRRSSGKTTSPSATHLGGRVDNLLQVASNVLSVPGNRIGATVFPTPAVPGLYTVVLNNTGSGWQETFLFQVPTPLPSAPAPLLVGFHKFGVSQNDILTRTSFFQEAQTRGWFCMAPLGATQVSFSSIESQINTQAALDYVFSVCNVDRARIYGVGFSMGGGSATNFAARHVDPSRNMFAAIANHTGGVALPHTFASEFDDDDSDDNIPNFGDNLETPDILEFWFGGTPQAFPFAYLRSSLMDLDPLTGTVAAGTDLSRNLSHVPLLDWYAAGDPLQYLVQQTDELHKHVRSQNTQNTLIIAPGNVHSWNTLDETAVCDWLSQFSLQLPRQASTLADEDGVWFYFQVTQDQGGAFTPFTWNVDTTANRLTLSATRNLQRLSVDSSRAGLSTTLPLALDLSTADATGDTVVLEDVAHVPSSVTRDGVPAASSFDAATHTLTLVETNSSNHVWVVTP